MLLEFYIHLMKNKNVVKINKMIKKINIPFFKENKDVLKSIEEIRRDYLTEFEIIESELSKDKLSIIENGIPKNISYTSGVDIFLEKRKSGENIKQVINLQPIIVKYRNNKMQLSKENIIEELLYKTKLGFITPMINYDFWRKNYTEDIESKKPKVRTIKSLNNIRKQILNHLEKTSGLKSILNHNDLEKRSMKILETHAQKIANKIIVEKNEKNKLEYYIEVFDTINAWGGAAIRMFYNNEILLKDENKTKGIPRMHVGLWIKKYIKVVELIKKGEYDDALNIIYNDIPGLGVSFGTKHIWFWSEFFINNNLSKTEIATVYDERMAKLLFGKAANAKDYSNARNIYKEIRDELNKNLKIDSSNTYTSKDVERSLFAFSQFYFNNNLTGWGDDEKLNSIPSKKKATEEEIKLLKVENAKINIRMKNKLKKGIDFDFASKIFEIRNPEMATLMSSSLNENIEIMPIDVKKVNGSKGKVYTVTNNLGKYSCTCSAYKYNSTKVCKHILSIKKS